MYILIHSSVDGQVASMAILNNAKFTICMEIQKTLNSQNDLEKSKQSWRNHAPWLQTILQSYSNQDRTALA